MKYPKVTVHTLTRENFYHTLLLLDTRILSQQNSQLFKFELSWLFKDGFYDMVTYGRKRKEVQHRWKYGKIKLDPYAGILEDGLKT
jgi:hypothetical protein